MIYPFINFFISLLHLYSYGIIAWVIITTLVSFKIINGYQPLVRKLVQAFDRLYEPVLRPIRNFLPNLGGFDISPIILILIINLMMGILEKLPFYL